MSDASALKRFEPPVTDTSAPFWDATRARRFTQQWCVDCGKAQWFPRDLCVVGCGGTNLEWRPSEGTGTVYSVTVEHKPLNPGLAPAAPYAVALIDLDEGTRFLSWVVGCPPDDVAIGQRVQVAWEPLSDGRHLPLFERVS